MDVEAKVVTREVAEQLAAAGWTMHTAVAWMQNSEGWGLWPTEDARDITETRRARKLNHGWHYAPDVSELLDALNDDAAVLQFRMGVDGCRADLSYAAHQWTYCAYGHTPADTLARLWMAVQAEHKTVALSDEVII